MSAAKTDPPTPETRQATFERGVALALHLWPDLTFAVENSLGGGDSADKRDWFAGAVAELFPPFTTTSEPTSFSSSSTTANPSTRQTTNPPPPSAEDLLMDVETRLLQVMDDEFGTVVDDDTAYDVAAQVVGLWRECAAGAFGGVEALAARWEARRGKKVSGMFKEVVQPGGNEEEEWEDDDDDDDDGDDDEDSDGSGDEEGSDEGGDVDMADAGAPTGGGGEKGKGGKKPPPPPPPEVDEDGFTKVTRKKR